jgi:hypothetical protein
MISDMTKDEGYQQSPLTKFLARLSPTEQLHVIMTHPFFTGKCPQCRYEFKQAGFPPSPWNCDECGWIDNSVQ